MSIKFNAFSPGTKNLFILALLFLMLIDKNIKYKQGFEISNNQKSKHNAKKISPLFKQHENIKKNINMKLLVFFHPKLMFIINVAYLMIMEDNKSYMKVNFFLNLSNHITNDNEINFVAFLR